MRRKPLTPEQLLKREQGAFARRIQGVFKNTGFEYLPTRDINRKFGDKVGELDQVFLFENIIVICEDTVAANPRKHLKNKKILADEIFRDKNEVVNWLKATFPTQFGEFAAYDLSRYQVFYLYFTKHKLSLTPADVKLFKPVKIVEPSTLGYLQKMASNIKLSARTDIFRYLGLSSKDVGTLASSVSQKQIETTIIYPSDNTGLSNDVRIVSFMISAETLLRNSYVLRKDNWENSIQLYQRLIERERILSIRKFLATKKTTFFNNIIVSLPTNVTFQDDEGNPVAINKAQNFTSHKMLIPDEYNSICVIDGQHRIFAHYEGTDIYEKEISKLRSKLHLLVTGLVFPAGMPKLEQRKFESEIFLDINSNARPVPPDVLLFIETLKDPFSDFGVARQALELLNTKATFKNLFQLSLMEESRIKIASIIKFALRRLVEISDDPDRPTLFNYWEDDVKRAALAKRDSEELLTEYVGFVADSLDQYFSALKSTFPDEWKDDASKLLSTTSINGFLIALRRTLKTTGIREFAFYRSAFSKLNIKFTKSDFGFASSQYNKLSKIILAEAFGLEEVGEEWVPREGAKSWKP